MPETQVLQEGEVLTVAYGYTSQVYHIEHTCPHVWRMLTRYSRYRGKRVLYKTIMLTHQLLTRYGRPVKPFPSFFKASDLPGEGWRRGTSAEDYPLLHTDHICKTCLRIRQKREEVQA